MRRSKSMSASLLVLALSVASQAVADPTSRLAESVTFRTVSPETAADFDPAPFLAFRDFLERSFPQVHGALEREIVSGYSLLYTWRGSDSSLPPVLLAAHYDVVPVVPGSLGRWSHPPFAGVIADGYVWGRGTLDDKVGVMGMLEALESLVASGFAPRRTVYLAFGHDEEVGGDQGARAIVDLLEARGVRLWFSLDEGMVIADGMAGLSEPVAMIGVAEKGFLTLELTASAPGGHSSMPPGVSAIGRLAEAVQRVEDAPLPAHLRGVAGDMLDSIAPMLPAGQRFAIGQRWLIGPFLVNSLAADPATNAMIRTTTAVTMIHGGVKANVLPSTATATVNFRVHPGDTADAIVAHVREAIDDPEIEVTVVSSSEASDVASTSSDAYEVLRATLDQRYPGIPVAPALVVGGTDSKHYMRIADDAYRFSPVRVGVDDTSRIHGIDERIGIDVYAEVAPFYEALLRRVAGPASD